MDPIDLHIPSRPSAEPTEHDLTEVDAAIELVRGGAAVRVRLVSLSAPELVIGVAVARGQLAGVDVKLDRSTRGLALTIGPRR